MNTVSVQRPIQSIRFAIIWHVDFENLKCENSPLLERNANLIHHVNMHLKNHARSFSPYRVDTSLSHPLGASQKAFLTPASGCRTCNQLNDREEHMLHYLEVAILLSLIVREARSPHDQVHANDFGSSQVKSVRGLLHHCHHLHRDVVILSRFDLLDHIHHHHKDYYQAWVDCSLGHQPTHHSLHAEQSAINEVRVATGPAPDYEKFMNFM